MKLSVLGLTMRMFKSAQAFLRGARNGCNIKENVITKLSKVCVITMYFGMTSSSSHLLHMGGKLSENKTGTKSLGNFRISGYFRLEL